MSDSCAEVGRHERSTREQRLDEPFLLRRDLWYREKIVRDVYHGVGYLKRTLMSTVMSAIAFFRGPPGGETDLSLLVNEPQSELYLSIDPDFIRFSSL